MVSFHKTHFQRTLLYGASGVLVFHNVFNCTYIVSFKIAFQLKIPFLTEMVEVGEGRNNSHQENEASLMVGISYFFLNCFSIPYDGYQFGFSILYGEERITLPNVANYVV